MAHPHRRRLPRHARHLASQLLRPRVAPKRASVLEAHVRQLSSAVNLGEHGHTLNPDIDRRGLGTRVVLGPETRSLLRQLLESRDLRVQQQLVREIAHQVQRRVLTAIRRSKAVEKARNGVRKFGSWWRAAPEHWRAVRGAAGRRLRTGSSWTSRYRGKTPAANWTRERLPQQRDGFGTLPDRKARARKTPARTGRTRS